MYKLNVLPEEIEKMPICSFNGKIKVVESYGIVYLKAVSYLSRQKIIGFDTESRPVFSPGQKNSGVALLQLSGPDKAFLFRIQSLGMRGHLCKLLSDPSILKIGAAVTDDIRGLQRFRPFNADGFVDLQQIAWEWGIRDKSVKKLAANILGVKVSKAQQLSNWEAPTLTSSQKMYAATDAWVCREMYLALMGSEKHPLTFEQLHPECQK